MTRVTKAELAGQVWRELLGYFFAHRESTVGVAHELGLTPGHVKALFVLDAERPVSMRELADALVCDPSNATWLVDRLEERELVERHPHPKDRRVKTVVLSPSGVAVKNKLIDRMSQPPPELLELDRAHLEELAHAVQLLPPHPPFYETTLPSERHREAHRADRAAAS